VLNNLFLIKINYNRDKDIALKILSKFNSEIFSVEKR